MRSNTRSVPEASASGKGELRPTSKSADLTPAAVILPRQLAEQRRLYVADAVDADPSLKLNDCVKRVYRRLVLYGWKTGVCNPSRETLSRDLAKSVRQIQEAIDTLRRVGLVATERRQRSSHYVMLWHQIFEAPLPPSSLDSDDTADSEVRPAAHQNEETPDCEVRSSAHQESSEVRNRVVRSAEQGHEKCGTGYSEVRPAAHKAIESSETKKKAAATRARDVAEKVPAAGPLPFRQNTPRKEPQVAAEPAGASGGMEELTAAVEAAFRAGCRRVEPGTAAEFLKAAAAHGRCRLTLAPHWIAEVTTKKRKWETGVSSARGFFLGSCRDSLLTEFADWQPPAELQAQMDAEARRAERDAIKARRTQPMPIDEALQACCSKSLVLAERLGERDAFHLVLNDLFADASEEDFARDALRLFASDMKREGIAECTPLELMGQLRKHQALRCPDCGDDGIICTPMDVEPDPVLRTTPSTAEWCTCELARVHRAIRPNAVDKHNAEAQVQLERSQQRLAKRQAEQAGPQTSDRDARLKAWWPRAESSRPNRIAAKCTTCHDTGARLVPSDANASGMIYEACTCAAAVTPEWIERENSALRQIPAPTPKQEAPDLLPQAGAVASVAAG